MCLFTRQDAPYVVATSPSLPNMDMHGGRACAAQESESELYHWPCGGGGGWVGVQLNSTLTELTMDPCILHTGKAESSHTRGRVDWDPPQPTHKWSCYVELHQHQCSQLGLGRRAPRDQICTTSQQEPWRHQLRGRRRSTTRNNWRG